MSIPGGIYADPLSKVIYYLKQSYLTLSGVAEGEAAQPVAAHLADAHEELAHWAGLLAAALEAAGTTPPGGAYADPLPEVAYYLKESYLVLGGTAPLVLADPQAEIAYYLRQIYVLSGGTDADPAHADPWQRAATWAEGASGVIGPAPGETFSPADQESLHLWLRAESLPVIADGAQITQWNDESPNGYAATEVQTFWRPEYYSNVQNGLPATFWSSYRLSINGGIGLGASSFSVYVVAGGVAVASGERALVDNGGWINGFIMARNANALELEFYNKGQALLTAADVMPAAGFSPKIFELVKQHGTRVDMWVNGAHNVFTTNATAIGSFTAGNPFGIGWNPLNEGFEGWAGYIFEIDIFGEAFDDETKQACRQYLADKYAIALE